MPAISGAGLGRSTYSRLDDLLEPAETMTVTYDCPGGHVFGVRLFVNAEIVPATWECRSCGTAATTTHLLAREVQVRARPGAAPKTHWQQLRERRSIAELEALLQERLAVLRGPARNSA